ncbi:tyrosine-type recombinase/integrase [Clostridium sp. D33t1_170424_F3]|uniref:tyrosine-type recombinase/integrase n=1 Tax=Clostridium sp. D33t1_170424_F3 TaxID=2787099 RepID=UPI0018AB8699|nr:tyrosine-type recombinase/integrase [Clostridium sp. D33t1_170424_F3]
MREKNTVIYERNSWYFRYKIINEEGKTKYMKKGGFESKEEAEYAAFLFEQQRMHDNDAAVQPGMHASYIAFRDYLQEWFDNRDSIKGVTRLVYERVLELILPEMDDILLGSVNSNYLSQLIAAISRQRASYGEKLYELFSMAIGDAFRQELIAYNPMVNVKKPARPKKELVRLDEEQRKTLFRAVFACEGRFELLLALLCGLKKGKIYGLKFTDFNINEKTVHVQRQVQPDMVGERKGLSQTEKELGAFSSNRVLSVHPLILRELQYKKAAIENNKKTYGRQYHDFGYVSCQKDGNRRSPAYMNNMLSRLCKKAGLSSLSVQDLRDQYAAILLEQGQANFLQLKGLLGYSTIEDVYDRYSGLADTRTDLAERVDRLFAE